MSAAASAAIPATEPAYTNEPFVSWPFERGIIGTDRGGRLAALGTAADVALADAGGRRDSRVGHGGRGRVPSHRGDGEGGGDEEAGEREHLRDWGRCASALLWCFGAEDFATNSPPYILHESHCLPECRSRPYEYIVLACVRYRLPLFCKLQGNCERMERLQMVDTKYDSDLSSV